MRYDEIRKLLTAYFTEAIKLKIERIAEKGRLRPEEREFYKQGVAYGTYALVAGFEGSPQLKSFYARSGLNVEEGSSDHQVISTEYEGAYSEFCQRVLEYDNSLSRYEFGAPVNVPMSPDGRGYTKRTTLREIVKLFVDEQIGAKVWRGKSELDKRHHYQLLQEILGSELQVSQLDEDHALTVKGVVLKYPKNRNKKAELKNLTLNELLAIDHSEKLSTKTRNQYLMSYASLFSWAKRHRYVKENLFEGLQIKAKKLGPKEKRLSFTPEQIRTMLRVLTTNEQGLIKKPYQKWGSLIAIYTGARLNEIAQLEIDDIKCQGGIHYFDLNEITADKRLKNEASARHVPIHSQLIELGLLEYVRMMRADGKKKLFPDFSYSPKTGYGRNLSRWFNDVFLAKIGLKSKQLVLHSLRHTLVTELIRAGVEEPIVREIIGHEREGVLQQFYNEGYSLLQRAEALEKFK